MYLEKQNPKAKVESIICMYLCKIDSTNAVFIWLYLQDFTYNKYQTNKEAT